MSKEKACRNCNLLHSGEKCPKCQSNESTESWKGKVVILNPENSEVAKKIKVSEKGSYAIKTR